MDKFEARLHYISFLMYIALQSFYGTFQKELDVFFFFTSMQSNW